MLNTKNAPKTACFWCSAPSLPSRHIKHADTVCLTCLDPPPASPCPSLILVTTNPFLNSTNAPKRACLCCSAPSFPSKTHQTRRYGVFDMSRTPPSLEHQNHTQKGMVLMFSCIFAMRHDEWVHLGPIRRVSHNPSLLTTKTRPYGCVFWS